MSDTQEAIFNSIPLPILAGDFTFPRRPAMTESEWLASANPRAMLAFLRVAELEWTTASDFAREVSRRASDRKLRLFACAVARRPGVWGGLDERSRRAVEAAELFVDGLATDEGRADAFALATESALEASRGSMGEFARVNAARAAVMRPQIIADHLSGGDWQLLGQYEIVPSAAQADILRDVVGNPFRPVTLPSSDIFKEEACLTCDGIGWYNEAGPNTFPVTCWRCGGSGVNVTPHPGPCPWLTPAVLGIASECYDSRDFSALPVLADALEDAGCGNEEILNHLRSGGVHCRGCWVLDCLTGRS